MSKRRRTVLTTLRDHQTNLGLCRRLFKTWGVIISVFTIGYRAFANFSASSHFSGEVYGLRAKGRGMSWQQFHDAIAGRTHPRRVSTLTEMANVVAFAASDEANGMTGTRINLGLGSLDD
jgi:hypothetical protein